MYHRFTYKGGSLWKLYFSDLCKNYQLYKKIIDTVLIALKCWSFTCAYVYSDPSLNGTVRFPALNGTEKEKIIDTVLFALKFWSFTYAYVYTFMQYLSSVHAIVK